MERFGRYLRELRERAGMRMKELANEMRWTSVYVSDIERGRRNPPSPAKIVKIAEILGVDSEKLLDLANKERKKVVLDLDEESPACMDFALMLARSWDGMTDDEAKQLKDILNKRMKKQDE
jgi:transcriptional regulator with XRE-family HTH domain